MVLDEPREARWRLRLETGSRLFLNVREWLEKMVYFGVDTRCWSSLLVLAALSNRFSRLIEAYRRNKSPVVLFCFFTNLRIISPPLIRHVDKR